MAHLSSVVIKIEGIRVFVTARKINHLDETAETKVLLDDDVYSALAEDRGLKHRKNSPLTAAMTKRIWVVSVAQVK